MAKNTVKKEPVTAEAEPVAVGPATQSAAETATPDVETTASPATPAADTAPVPDADPAVEIVELFVDRDPSDKDPNVVIGINGKNWVMPRGETSRVPRYVADEYERSRQAQYKADRTIAGMKGIKAK